MWFAWSRAAIGRKNLAWSRLAVARMKMSTLELLIRFTPNISTACE
jgi:hypothetical protein